MNSRLEVDFANFKPDIFLAELKKRHSEFKKIDDVEAALCDYYSWLNFARYYRYFESYLSSDKYNYYFIMSNHEFSINIKQINTSSVSNDSDDNVISLLLVFQRDGLVRFLCLDDENDEKEDKTFVIYGTFSSSNMIKNMHKINRLLKLISYD